MRTIGVDLGGTKCLAVALEDGRVVDERRVPTPVGGPALLDAIALVAADLEDGGPVIGVGVGAPGLVDRAGALRFAPNLPGVTDLAVGAQ
ncbi:MAG: ROK family protein, partial [Actinomycetota bacterium]|nr:ROK family protein [Actinomycetota bacterium]